MNLLSDPKNLNRLFISRSHNLQLEIGSDDTNSGSRIGGRAPKCFAQSIVKCPYCSRPMVYYLTMSSDVFSAAIESGQSISIFYCPDLSCLLRSRRLKEPPSLVALSHEDSARGDNENILDSHIEGRRIHPGQIVEDVNEYKERDQASKIGGYPGLIQRSGLADVEKLRTEGLNFLFQFNEESYPADMKYGRLPFAFGAVYVFSQFSATKIDVSISAMFWQCT